MFLFFPSFLSFCSVSDQFFLHAFSMQTLNFKAYSFLPFLAYEANNQLIFWSELTSGSDWLWLDAGDTLSDAQSLSKACAGGGSYEKRKSFSCIELY